MLEFPAQELRKYFKMGDHVKVIAGRFEGDTGLIVRVEENFVILFSDLTMHEVSTGVKKNPARGGGEGATAAASHPSSPALPCRQLKVLPRDLQLCSETASGVDVGGQHEWGELVQLDPQTVGVIVRLERETFQVSPGRRDAERSRVFVLCFPAFLGAPLGKGDERGLVHAALCWRCLPSFPGAWRGLFWAAPLPAPCLPPLPRAAGAEHVREGGDGAAPGRHQEEGQPLRRCPRLGAEQHPR